MNTYHHTKIDLATAVARNMSKNTIEPVWLISNGIKSIKTMKYCDTTVLQVAAHSETPMPTSATMFLRMWWKGKEKKVF